MSSVFVFEVHYHPLSLRRSFQLLNEKELLQKERTAQYSFKGCKLLRPPGLCRKLGDRPIPSRGFAAKRLLPAPSPGYTRARVCESKVSVPSTGSRDHRVRMPTEAGRWVGAGASGSPGFLSGRGMGRLLEKNFQPSLPTPGRLQRRGRERNWKEKWFRSSS